VDGRGRVTRLPLESVSANTTGAGRHEPPSLDPGREFRRLSSRERLRDGAFLVAVTVASSLSSVRGLGFYSDDWAFLGTLRTSRDQSFLGLVHEQFAQNGLLHLRMRPTQIVLQAILYRLFGLRPIGYHVFCLVLFGAIALLLYHVLIRVGSSRIFACSIPLLFVTMANFSTDRVWFASLSYPIALCLYLVSLLADMKVIELQGHRRIGWTCVAVVSFVAGGLANETVIPLFLVNALILYQGLRPHRDVEGVSRRAGILMLLAHLIAVALLISYKVRTAEFLGDLPGGFFTHVRRLIAGSIIVNAGSYGVGLPATAWWAIRHATPWPILAALAVGLLSFGCLYRIAGEDTISSSHVRRQSVRSAAAGAIVFTLGYAVFLTTGRIVFTSTGIGNRTGMVPALGAAMVIAGMVGFASLLIRSTARRRVAFVLLISSITLMGSITLGTLSGYWQRAWRDEQRVLANIQSNYPDLPHGTTLIVYGVCPYVGPAIVFESSWDLAGALRVRYEDPTLDADVTGHMSIAPDALRTSVYGNWSSVYPFGRRLLLYDLTTGQRLRLINEATAIRHFGSATPGLPASCAPGVPGRGVDLLPFDRVYEALEAHGFR
jgi:hypothetical protein